MAEPVRASESASRSVTETDSPSKALALICMLYRSSVPADCCTSPGIEPPKAPKCSFAIPPGGTEKSRRAVLQTPCEGVRRCSRPRCARGEVKAFLDGLRVNQDRPQRGYNSFVPLEPMNQLQVDLADMRAFGGKPYPFMLVAIDALTKKVAAEPLKDRLASTTAAGMKKVFQALGVPANVYSDDGAEFKREFKELMDFWDVEKQVTRGHAYFAERTIRTIKEAMLRRIAAGAGRRGQWHLMLADILSQINGRKHATTQVAPNLAYSDPEMAEIALRNIERRAKHKVTRPEIKVGDMVRIRVKPIESRGSYRVNEIAWSEKVYRVVSAESGEMGARFGLEGWPEKVVHRDLRKVPENSAPEPRVGGAIPPAEAAERPQAPTSLLMLSVPLRLYNVSDSSACHSLMSSSSSGRGGGLGDSPTSQSIHSTSHAALASNQRRASSARWARVAWP